MPKLSVWLVRASLIHMGVGFLFGSLILHHKGIPIFTWTWRLLNPHIELMIFGWTMQFIMGIAFFILPRFSDRPNRYGAEYLGWWSFFCMNSGIILTAISYWFGWQYMAIMGRGLVLLAVITFIVMSWSRVKPLGGFAASQSS